jgi:hypothetical protein
MPGQGLMRHPWNTEANLLFGFAVIVGVTLGGRICASFNNNGDNQLHIFCMPSSLLHAIAPAGAKTLLPAIERGSTNRNAVVATGDLTLYASSKHFPFARFATRRWTRVIVGEGSVAATAWHLV